MALTTKELISERATLQAGYKAWSVTRPMNYPWYRVEYYTGTNYANDLSIEFDNAESLFNWIDRFEAKHNLIKENDWHGQATKKV